MSKVAELATKVYSLLIACYPMRFRVEFGKEMQDVFETTITEQRPINEHLWQLLWREIREWPGLVLREHLKEWNLKMTDRIGPSGNMPLIGIDWFAALTIFLLPPIAALLTLLTKNEQKWLGILFILLFLGILLVASIIAVIRKLPRWFPPYIGIVVTGAVFLGPFWWIWERIYPSILRILGPMNSWSQFTRILYQGMMNAFLWFLVLLAGLLLVTLLRIWSSTRIIWQRIRDDWTQLSFLIYGGIITNIALIFDEYQHDQPWKIAAWVCLAIGCWLYLYSNNSYGRIMYLLCGATSAMWIVAIGKWFIVPIQNWPIWTINHPPGIERWFEAGRTMADWVCIVITLLLPALINSLPRSKRSSQISET